MNINMTARNTESQILQSHGTSVSLPLLPVDSGGLMSLQYTDWYNFPDVYGRYETKSRVTIEKNEKKKTINRE